MLTLKFQDNEISVEIDRIINFIKDNTTSEDKVILGISGGLDSDVTARLAVMALGRQRVKGFFVVQKEMEEHHYKNAVSLASELKISFLVINLEEIPYLFIEKLEHADKEEEFNSKGLLDTARAKCSIRTVLFSHYQDRGYVVLGTSNRTEYETGFYLPFGDGIAHLKPIVHLYKSQVFEIANKIGVQSSVINQAPSAGFWKGQEDLEDLSYWLLNEAPIQKEIAFCTSEDMKAQEIRGYLTTEKVDLALFGISRGLSCNEINGLTNIPIWIVEKLIKLVQRASLFKNKPINVRLQ